jgi:hypothetical protein
MATQKWRHPQLSQLDRATHCTRCDRGLQEDIIHCIWNCPQSLVVWDWVRIVLQLAAPTSSVNLELTFQHVLLAEDLPADYCIPTKLWAILRAVTCWEIWKARCAHYMEDICTTPASIIQKIWHRLSIYLGIFWRQKLTKIRTRGLDPIKATKDMQRDFSKCTQIWCLHELRLRVPKVPPRPP